MKIVIIEDETPALSRITKLIQKVEPGAEILGTADSIESAVALFGSCQSVDVALMDIELADGQSFEIFKRCQVSCPVIFTTAYDEYALKAFKVNSIDYLLKPIEEEELRLAIQKYKNLNRADVDSVQEQIKELLQHLGDSRSAIKERFLVKSGQRLLSISESDIAYFHAHDKLTFLISKGGNKYLVDYTLDELAGMLHPNNFFRLNRQYIAAISSIVSVHTYFNGKLKIELQPKTDDEVLVSRERATEFKIWMGA